MEWHRNNSNGAVASPQSQQYLLPTTSSMVANGHNQLPTVQQNSIHKGSFNANKEPLLHNLLNAKSNEDFLKVQQAALGKFRSIKPHHSSSHMKSNVNISTYKPAQDVVPVPENRSAIAVQNTVGSNYRISNYVNSLHQTSQQPPSVAMGQQFGNGYNATAVQQPLQNSQTLQNYQAAYSYPQQNRFNSVRPPANTAQIPCQQMAPNMPSSKRYNLQTDASRQFKSQKLPAETNFSAPNQDCRNIQNITGPSLANYRSLAPNMLSHAPQQQMNVPQQQMNVPQLQTVPQLDGNANYYTQSQQRPNLQNILVSNSPQMSSSPPTYTQAVSNSQNGFNSSQRQNYVAPNVQQPAQMGNPPPVQSSVGEEQSRAQDLIALNVRKREMLKLLLVYRNVRQQYELLNQENNLLRQRLQANASQDNARPPPLLSSLPTTQPQANCVMAGQQNVTQGLPVQNKSQVNSTRGFHSQGVYDNPTNAANQVGLQNIAHQENAVHSQMLKSDNGNHVGQNNYSILEGSQANFVNGSSLQSQSSETTSRELRGQTKSSPNSNNESLVHNRHGLHSHNKQTSLTQIPNAPFPEKDGYGDLSSCTTGLTENGKSTSVSWEAIEASLPLWKTSPHSSSHSSKSLECQESPSPVDSLAAFRLLDEITSGPTHEISSTIPVQKQDSAIPNPQIAIVSPLVQSKDALHEDYQLSKIRLEGSAVENATINGFTNSHESDCFRKILQELESLGTNTINNMETSRSKVLPVASQDIVGSSLPSSTQSSSQIEIETSSENVDDGLQISGICTLVEGNSFYDSSIAMIFDETSDATALPHTDDLSKIVDTSCIAKAPCSTSPEAANVTVKSEPVEEAPPMAEGSPVIEGDLHCNMIPCSDMQAEENLVSAQQETFCEVESSAISDQLTELLTEFPYGIKNYMSENICESTKGQSVKTTDKPLLKACAAPEDVKPVNQGPEINDIKSEMVPIPSENLQHAAETDSETLMDLGCPGEKLSGDVQHTEGVSILAKDADGDAIQVMDTCSDDFEILSNSPASDIHITILDQAEIPKIFPDQNEHIGTNACNEITFGSLPECADTVEPETKSTVLKKESDVTGDAADKNLFCCLFSWINLTNKNAPKCSCKQLDSTKVETTQLLPTNTASVLKADPSPQRPEPTLKDSPKPSIGGAIGLETVQPTDRPPKLEPVGSDNEEIKQPLDKPPKLERIVSEPDCVKSCLDFAPQPEKGLKQSTSLENLQSVKDCLMQNQPAVHEESFTSSPENGEPTCRKRKSHSPNKFKSQGSRKSEKLIVKTDFLKGKHPYKEKGKREGKNSSNLEQWILNKSGSQSGFLNSQGKHGKKPRGEKKAEQNVSAIRTEQSPDKQADKSWNRHKFPGADRSSRSRGVGKRKDKESHFEKTRKVPSVQEYLERKRELCKKRSEKRTEPPEGFGDSRHSGKRPEMSSDLQPTSKRPLSPAKTNVTSKENKRSETPKAFNRKDQSQSRGPHESGYRKRKESNKGQKVPENKTSNLKSSSSKDKIYLSPCVSSRRASCEGVNLAKLQIRHSPDKPKNIERRRSLESSGHAKHSNSDLKTVNSPKMLEFKLYPEFAHGSPTTQDKAVEATDPKEKSVVEGIKSSKEAWCNSIPLKKRRVENVEGQGFQKSPSSAGSTPNYKPIEKNTTRPSQDSRSTFNVFKQMYHEKRSKSLDHSQGNS